MWKSEGEKKREKIRSEEFEAESFYIIIHRPGARRDANRVIRGGSWNNNASNCGRRTATTTRPTTATTIPAFASPAHGNGPTWCVHGYIASANALTIAPDLFPATTGDK